MRGRVESHAQNWLRANCSRDEGYPTVLIAILAKQKEAVLPLYLRCIESLDYPKSRISLYVRTNNNTDRTREILWDWVARVKDQYARYLWDDRDLPEPVQDFDVHEWNSLRFRVLGWIRQESMRKTLEWGCDRYFVADCDNYLVPSTLWRLVDLNLPIVAPLLRHTSAESRYANFHGDVDDNGYYRHTEAYDWVLDGKAVGIVQVPVVHCTYLVRSDAIPALTYDDGSARFEYVVFSDSARRHGIRQYVDSRSFYGCLTLDESAESLATAERLMAPSLEPIERDCQTSADPTAVSSEDSMNQEYTRYRLLLADAVRNTPEYPASRFNGKGVVVCGGGKYFTQAWVCINMLRQMGCRLPVELWYLGREELSEAMAQLLQPLGVRCVDATEVAVRHPARILNGWELKPYAIIHSSFEEVLFLDADNVPIVDVTALFDWPEYKQWGAVFWPDYQRLARDRDIWQICNIPFRDEPEFESGQVLVNKRTCWRELQVTMHLNEHSDFYYRHVFGDKETFHMAWRKCRTEYGMTSHPIKTLPGTMCQHDFAGNVIFQHRNLCKWQLSDNVSIDGFRFESTCFELLRQLKSKWNGRCVPSSYRSPLERDAYQKVVRQGTYRYHRVGYDERIMQFKRDGVIGLGSAACEREWMVKQALGTLWLVILGEGRRTCALTRG
ncbi:MAG TPA: hypothetical protein VIV60_11460, partial [Polyangiaceae bacterium]